ncbi:MAG: phage tail sheath family protein [Methylobacter sp.]
MPEYLAPGVYVEETSFRAKSIEGVSTTTTGFIGPTRYGPVHLEPDILTSLGEFERLYGDGQKLKVRLTKDGSDTLEPHNYLWHAAAAFFNEGGRRLYVSRVFRRIDNQEYDPAALSEDKTVDLFNDGHGRYLKDRIVFRAKYPGTMGNLRIQVEIRAGRNLLGSVFEDGKPRAVIGALKENDIVWIRDERTSPPASPPFATGDLWLAKRDSAGPINPRDPGYWKFEGAIGSPISSPLITGPKFDDDDVPPDEPGKGISIRVVTISINVFSPIDEPLGTWRDLPIDPNHKTAGLSDSFVNLFRVDSNDRTLPFVVELKNGPNGLDIIDALFSSMEERMAIQDGDLLQKGISVNCDLAGGNDGLFPAANDYSGIDDEARNFKTGLKQFEDLEDISIVAAPGSTWYYKESTDRAKEANTIILNLLSHAERMRYRIAVIDSAERQTIAEIRKVRAKIDSKHGALYYPWVRVLDPITRVEIALPPSGFVAGIYARNDIERAVYKAPANEVVRGAIGFDIFLNRSQQEVLNPEGINCFRYFEGRGMRLWGARTISSDPEWKYVNLRRYFAYLERSIDKGTQWAVFEPNGERLWANVRSTIEDFLLNEWQSGALLGDKPEKSYFVKCDRSTMSQNDLDNGRLICLIGVAPLRPAEFVIFRIGQWTADRKV